jgi:hypothetical protein
MDVKIGFDKRTPISEQVDVPLFNSLNAQPLTDFSGSVLVTETEQFLDTSLQANESTSVSVFSQPQGDQQWRSNLVSWYFDPSKQAFTVGTQISPPSFTSGTLIQIQDAHPHEVNGVYSAISQDQLLNTITFLVQSTVEYQGMQGNIISMSILDGVATTTLDKDIAPDLDLQTEFSVTISNAWPPSLVGEWSAIKTSSTQLVIFPDNQQSELHVPLQGQIQLTVLVPNQVRVIEQFPELSAVSSSILGIPREETQLALFEDVATYGLDINEWDTYRVSNDTIDPPEWRERMSQNHGRHFSTRFKEYPNQSALALENFPVSYRYPFNASWAPDGIYRSSQFTQFLNFMRLGNELHDHFEQVIVCDEQDVTCDFQKRSFLESFPDPTIVRMSSNTDPFSTFNLGANVTTARAFAIIEKWTDMWRLINTGNGPLIPQLGEAITKEYILSQLPSSPSFASTLPGYLSSNLRAVNLLQSKKSFRYQPGRISGFTFGIKAETDLGSSDVIAEWGCVNSSDQFVFRLQGGTISIVRRSKIPLSDSSLRLSGVSANSQSFKLSDNPFDTESYHTVEIGQDSWTGDQLNGTGDPRTNPSAYLFDVTKVTMLKIEFGWYGAIGARFYAYVPVGSDEARWVVLTTIVIENSLGEPCLVNPYFKFSYMVTVRNPSEVTKPQVAFKYGSSYYIDGGDSGTQRPISVAGKPVQVFANQEGTLLSFTTKSQFQSLDSLPGVNPFVTNRKISLVENLSTHSTALAKMEIKKCVGCPEFAHTYLPHLQTGITGYLSDDPDDADRFTQLVQLSPNRDNLLGSWSSKDQGAKIISQGIWLTYLDLNNPSGNLITYVFDSTRNITRSKSIPLQVNVGNSVVSIADQGQLRLRLSRFSAVAVSPKPLLGDQIELRFLNPVLREQGLGFQQVSDVAMGVTNWIPQSWNNQNVVNYYQKHQWVILSDTQEILDNAIPVQDPQSLVSPGQVVYYQALSSDQELMNLENLTEYVIARVFEIDQTKYFSLKSDAESTTEVILEPSSGGIHFFRISILKNQLLLEDAFSITHRAQLVSKDAANGLERGEFIPGPEFMRMDRRIPRPDGFNTGWCSKLTVRRLPLQIIDEVKFTNQIPGRPMGFYVFKDNQNWLAEFDSTNIQNGQLILFVNGQLLETRCMFESKGQVNVSEGGITVSRFWAQLNYDPAWILPDQESFTVALSALQVSEFLERQTFFVLETTPGDAYYAVCHLRDNARVNNVEIFNKTNAYSESLNPSWWLQIGHGAQAHATLNGDQVDAIWIDTPGKNYLKPPRITIEGGQGSGATAWSEINAQGELTRITVRNGGTNYQTPPLVIIQDDGLQIDLANGTESPIMSSSVGNPPSYTSTGRVNSLLVDTNNSLPSRGTRVLDTYYVGSDQSVLHDTTHVFAINKQIITPNLWNNEAFFVNVTNLDESQPLIAQTTINIVED